MTVLVVGIKINKLKYVYGSLYNFLCIIIELYVQMQVHANYCGYF